MFRIVKEVMPVQPEKAESPISVTLSGILTEVRLVQPENAEGKILVIPSSILTDVMPVLSKEA